MGSASYLIYCSLHIHKKEFAAYTARASRMVCRSTRLGPGSQIGPKRPIEYMAKCCIQRLLYAKVLYSLYGKVPIEAKRKEKVSTGCNANSYLYICRHGINYKYITHISESLAYCHGPAWRTKDQEPRTRSQGPWRSQ